jgi:hypothetical protein
MKPHARRHQGFENERGVIYLVPRPAARPARLSFWHTNAGLVLLAGAGAFAWAVAIYSCWEAGLFGGR